MQHADYRTTAEFCVQYGDLENLRDKTTAALRILHSSLALLLDMPQRLIVAAIPRAGKEGPYGPFSLSSLKSKKEKTKLRIRLEVLLAKPRHQPLQRAGRSMRRSPGPWPARAPEGRPCGAHALRPPACRRCPNSSSSKKVRSSVQHETATRGSWHRY